eukprot:6333064-Amphidinium_carterae.1
MMNKPTLATPLSNVYSNTGQNAPKTRPCSGTHCTVDGKHALYFCSVFCPKDQSALTSLQLCSFTVTEQPYYGQNHSDRSHHQCNAQSDFGADVIGWCFSIVSSWHSLSPHVRVVIISQLKLREESEVKTRQTGSGAVSWLSSWGHNLSRLQHRKNQEVNHYGEQFQPLIMAINFTSTETETNYIK